MKAKTEKSRHIIFDALRGVMVVLMIISHVIDFIYAGDNIMVAHVRNLTATTAFTGFILISGIANYFAYIETASNDVSWQRRKLSIVKRTFSLLLSYYFVALVSLLLQNPLTEMSMSDGLKILAFVNVPTYTEFILTFILIGLALVLFGRVLQRVSKSVALTLGLGIVLYILGSYYYQVDLGNDILNAYKALFAGHGELFRFPLLQYAPVYLIGLNIGYLYLHWDNKRRFTQLTMIHLLSSLALLLLNARFTWTEIVGDGGLLLQRWPPSLSFLLAGLAIVWFFQLVLLLIKDVTRLGFVRGTLAFLGANALQFYIYHVLLLKVYERFVDWRTDNIWLVSLAVFALLAVCTAILKFFKVAMVKLPWKINVNIVKLSDTRIWQARHVYRLLAVLAILGLAYFLVAFRAQPSDVRLIASQVEGLTTNSVGTSDPYWWSNDFRSMSTLHVVNSSSQVLSASTWVMVAVNADNFFLDLEGVQAPVHVVRFLNGQYQELTTVVKLSTNNQVEIYYPIAANIAPGQADASYFVYYNGIGQRAEQPLNQPVMLEGYNVELGARQGTEMTGQVERTWNLKNYSAGQAELVYSVVVSNVYQQSQSSPVAWIENSAGVQNKYNMVAGAEQNVYSLTLPLTQLTNDSYKIRAAIENSPFVSNWSNFYVSDPLIVAWTMDWEGYDLTQSNMQSISDISAKYKVPITQFFNPRIFAAAEISSSRRKALVNWVKQRAQNNGDEIALHLHMHIDMITAVGMTAKTEPKWGGRDNGHDVLTTAYDYSEFKQILDWSLAQFQSNGLPVPVSYRAGGWFLDEENLQTLQDVGFDLDSSGREYIVYGSNQIPSPWTLTATTRPYHPSPSNQNVAGNMRIWEFPNNGMDSTNNDFSTLKKKFDANYSGKPLTETQVVTYLSHPHWFTSYDDDDMIELFEYLAQFTYESDQGPVVYSTLQSAMEELEQ